MAEVLIVDDEADAREPLGKFLVKVGHAVRLAPGGEEALAAVVFKLPEVVLLDLLMPR
jgi:two-component system nitrogen regulation response regulator NtrX